MKDEKRLFVPPFCSPCGVCSPVLDLNCSAHAPQVLPLLAASATLVVRDLVALAFLVGGLGPGPAVLLRPAWAVLWSSWVCVPRCWLPAPC